MAVLALGLAQGVSAQARGDHVRVVSPAFTGEATVVSVTPDTLVLMPRRGEAAVRLARSSIERLDVAVLPEQAGPRWSFKGCALGAALGAVAAAVAEETGATFDNTDHRKVMWLAIGVGAVGCALGAALGGGGRARCGSRSWPRRRPPRRRFPA